MIFIHGPVFRLFIFYSAARATLLQFYRVVARSSASRVLPRGVAAAALLVK